MIALLLNFVLMGITLSGLLKVYFSFPFFNENPTTTGISAMMILLIIIWIFPKIIGLIIKFAFFCCIVYFICQAMGWKLDIFKPEAINAEDAAEKITQAIEDVKMLAEPNKSFSAKATQVPNARTVQFNDENFVLYGIDAPEMAQSCKNRNGMDYSCGQIAKEKLQSLTLGQELSCVSQGTNAKGQKVASCVNSNGDDIAALMVRSGWAIADKKQTDTYVAEEISAYKQKVGMWEGKFQEPKKWRLNNTNQVAASEKNKNETEKKTPFQKVMGFLKK